MLFTKKFISIFTIVLILQVIASYFIFDTLKQDEDDEIKNKFKNEIEIISNQIEIFYQEVKLIVSKDIGIFQVNGKYLQPDQFNYYLANQEFTDFVILEFQRWIPRISHEERPTYEAFGETYIRTNFSILDFVRIDNVFTPTPSPNRTHYYPFTLSFPEFKLVPLGGDFLFASSFTFIEALNRLLPTLSSRVNLVRLDSLNTQNYGTFLNTPVYPIGFNLSNPVEEDVMGFIQIVFVFSDIINGLIENTKQINDFGYFLLDLDVPDDQAITAKSNNFQEFFTNKKIETLIDNNKFSVIQDLPLENKNYQLVAIFNQEAINEQRDFFPESMLILSVLIFLFIDILILVGIYTYKLNVKNTQSNIYRNLLGYINHEIRNLLNGIIGNTDILKMSLDDINNSNNNRCEDDNNQEDNDSIIIPRSVCHDVQESVNNIHLSCISLGQIVNDTLNSKMTIIKFDVQHEELALLELANFIKNLVKISLEQKPEIDYQIQLFDDDYRFFSDQTRLVQILLNFVQNSINFTKEGHIIFRVQKKVVQLRSGESKMSLVFEVIDTGVGIEENLQKHIFTKKLKKVLSNDHHYTGSGIGLYFSKIIAKDLDAEVGFHSQTGQGSTFWLIFPDIEKLEKGTDSEILDEVNIAQ